MNQIKERDRTFYICDYQIIFKKIGCQNNLKLKKTKKKSIVWLLVPEI